MKFLLKQARLCIAIIASLCSNSVFANGQVPDFSSRANLWFLQPWLWGIAAFVLGMIVLSALRGNRRY